MFSFPLDDDAELRLLGPWHAEALFACVEENREYLASRTFIADRVRDLTGARRLLQEYTCQHVRDTGHYGGIWLNGHLVGAAMFRSFDPCMATAEVGAWLVPEAHGRRLATQALRHLIDWAINQRGIQRVQLQSSPRNTHGRSLARRLGMTYEGTLRSAVMVNGVRHDSDVWAVLAHEWSAPPTEEK